LQKGCINLVKRDHVRARGSNLRQFSLASLVKQLLNFQQGFHSVRTRCLSSGTGGIGGSERRYHSSTRRDYGREGRKEYSGIQRMAETVCLGWWELHVTVAGEALRDLSDQVILGGEG
jgi:hypothetical protein